MSTALKATKIIINLKRVYLFALFDMLTHLL